MAQPISDRFSSTGVKAGTANLPKLFSIEPAKAVNEIKETEDIMSEIRVLSLDTICLSTIGVKVMAV